MQIPLISALGNVAGKTGNLKFGLSLHLHPYFVYTSSEFSSAIAIPESSEISFTGPTIIKEHKHKYYQIFLIFVKSINTHNLKCEKLKNYIASAKHTVASQWSLAASTQQALRWPDALC